MLLALPRLAVCACAVLLNGVLAGGSAHTVLDPGFLQCQESFFRRTPPQSLSELGLEERCHKHLTGRPFAALFNSECQTTVYTALHLSPANGWGSGEQSKAAEEQINEDSHVAVPALYKGSMEKSPSSSSSPLLKWDSQTAQLIRMSAIPMCSKTSGKIYVHSGTGGLKECGGKVLWSAVCCAAADGDGSFSVGLVKEGGVRVVNVKALEELIGVTGLFSGGCGEIGSEREKKLMALFKEQLGSTQTQSADALSENHMDEQNALETETSDSGNEEVTSQHVTREAQSHTSSLKEEMDLQESTNDTESGAGRVLLYILSSTISLLYKPFSPFVNTLINLPSQITYVLQEDLAVLASVPSDSLTLANNLGSGVTSGVSCALSTLYQTGELSACTLYSCLSPLVSNLLLAFEVGFTGTGTLATDALGILTGTAGSGLGIGKMVLESVWNQMTDYLCVVGSEMGQQASTVGSGIGTLTWRSGRGVGHLLNMVIGIVGGAMENTITNVQEAFVGNMWESSESQSSGMQSSKMTTE